MSLIYLDNAATTFPKPKAVPKRVLEVIERIGGNPGRGMNRMSLDALRVIFGTRESLATLLGVSDATRIAFTKNATEALNIAIKGVLTKGDHVITTSFEHNSVARTLHRVEGEGVRVTRLTGNGEGLVTASDVSSAITRETRLVVITHASNVFGTIQPVSEIGAVCRERGVLFLVDSAQTVGALLVDVPTLNIDMLAGTGHKALFGPQGTGFLYVREGLDVRPLIDGGTGEVDVAIEMPDCFEAGTMNTPGIGGLGAGIDFVLGEGIESIRKKELRHNEKLLGELSSIKGLHILGSKNAEERVSLVAFTIDSMKPSEVGRLLDEEHSIMVRSGALCAPEAHKTAGTYPDGTVRVSPSYMSVDSDIDAFIKAIKAIAGK